MLVVTDEDNGLFSSCRLSNKQAVILTPKHQYIMKPLSNQPSVIFAFMNKRGYKYEEIETIIGFHSFMYVL